MDWTQKEGSFDRWYGLESGAWLMVGLESDGKFGGWIGVRWKV
jgi:hypothetical protein